MLIGAAMGYFSLQTSLNQNWLSFWSLAFINVLPLWAFISKYSKKLIFDELLFVIILTGSQLIVVSLLDQGQRTSFSFWNWFGLLIAFAGLILMKTNWKKKSTNFPITSNKDSLS